MGGARRLVAGRGTAGRRTRRVEEPSAWRGHRGLRSSTLRCRPEGARQRLGDTHRDVATRGSGRGPIERWRILIDPLADRRRRVASSGAGGVEAGDRALPLDTPAPGGRTRNPRGGPVPTGPHPRPGRSGCSRRRRRGSADCRCPHGRTRSARMSRSRPGLNLPDRMSGGRSMS